MDDDDDLALPPPIRRSPRAALERQTALDQSLIQDNGHHAAPIVPRSRSTSMDSAPLPSQSTTRTNPLASHPITTTGSIPGVTNFSRHRFSHPFWHELKPIIAESPKPSLPVTPPIPRRSPARLKSYRSNKRLPPHLRRQPSLETIASVTTTQSIDSDEDEPDPPEVSAPSSYLFTLEDDPPTTPIPFDARSLASSTHSSSIGSQQSSKPAITPINSRESEPQSPRSLFQKMTHRKQSESSSIPDRLVIERKVSIDRISHPSSLTSSSQSLALERPPVSGPFQTERSQSGSSSEWSASNFDVSTLSEADIKKCKKKGINPALYAEMKAARKGKWTSPIAGNSFL
jgi:hypothetical protein